MPVNTQKSYRPVQFSLFVYSVSLLIICLDQSIKIVIARVFELGESFPVVPGIFHLTLVHNRGAAFGILHGRTDFFVVVSLVCVVMIMVMTARPFWVKRILDLDPGRCLVAAAIGLILGGAVGNLIDRLRLGYVVDFLDFRVWPVFNIADSAITVGCLLIFWSYWSDRKRPFSES